MIIFLLLISFSVYANVSILAYTKQYIIEKDELNGIFQTTIILGAAVYENSKPCPMLQDRLDVGILLFENKCVDTLLLTGDHGQNEYDEVNGMKDYVLNKGVDKSVVFLDHAGFSTYESMFRANEIYQVKSAVIVTQEFHLARSVYIARKMGINAYGIKADIRRYPQSEMMRLQLREYLARVKDYIYIHILKPDPTYLGEQIPITGNSEITYDN